MTASGPAVTLRLPSVLATVVGKQRFSVRGKSIGQALESAFAELPVLRHHLTEESGGLRPHILCLVNGESVPRDEVSSVALSPGDEILIHQAISGG